MAAAKRKLERAATRDAAEDKHEEAREAAEARRIEFPALAQGTSAFKTFAPINCCGTCKGKPLTTRRLQAKDYGANGELRKKPELQQEIALHGFPTTGDLSDFKGRVRGLIAVGACFLSTPAAPAAAAAAANAMHIATPPPSPARSDAAPESPYHVSPAHKRNCDLPQAPTSTPQRHRESRGAAAERRETADGDKRALPLLDFPNLDEKPHMRPIYKNAFYAMFVAKVQRFDDYVNYSRRRPDIGDRILTPKEWVAATNLGLHVAVNVLDKYLGLGREVSAAALADVRAHRDERWRERWPYGHHCDGQQCLKCDTAWPVPGFTSPHGVTHIQEAMTQLVLEVCFLTKEKDDAHGTLTRALRFVSGFTRTSGDMDPAGTATCAQRLCADAPWGFERCWFCTDGDNKGGGPSSFCAATAGWHQARCKCHKGKNLRLSCTKGMGAVTCACIGNPGNKLCGNIPGYRFADALAHKITAWYYVLMWRAVYRYLPELDRDLEGEMDLPADVGAPHREVSRKAAINEAADELAIMLGHINGEHKRCTHAPLPADHPNCHCKAQIAHLADVVQGIINSLGEILTPFGLVDINATESLHAVLRKYRTKGLKWGAAQCWPGETCGFLHWQQLQLAYWGHEHEPLVDLAAELKYQLGVDLAFTAKELAGMKKDLEVRVAGKERRSTEEAMQKRDAARARRAGRAPVFGSSYMSGGSAAAVAFGALDVAQILSVGGLGAGEAEVVLGKSPEGEHRAGDMRDVDGYDEAAPEAFRRPRRGAGAS